MKRAVCVVALTPRRGGPGGAGASLPPASPTRYDLLMVGRKKSSTSFSLPGGKVEAGDASLEGAACRELGIDIYKIGLAWPIEEQGAATQEISRNVQQAAHGTQQVSSNITDVQRGATETGSASAQVLSAAQSLSQDSNRLKVEVANFLQSVRAA